MKKNLRKGFALLLAATMCFGMMNLTVFAEEGENAAGETVSQENVSLGRFDSLSNIALYDTAKDWKGNLYEEAKEFGVNLEGIAVPTLDDDGWAQIDYSAFVDGKVTLLFKLQVQGAVGTPYLVKDEGIKWVAGDPMEGNIPNRIVGPAGETGAVMFATRTFTEEDIVYNPYNGAYWLDNCAILEPAEGVDTSPYFESEVWDSVKVKMPPMVDVPLRLSVAFQDHVDGNTVDGTTPPEIQVDYSYEVDGEPVEGSFTCLSSGWKLDETDSGTAGWWWYDTNISVPEGVDEIHFTESNFEVKGYARSSGEVTERTISLSEHTHDTFLHVFRNTYTRLAALNVGISVDKDTADVGDTLTYTITVKNTGGEGDNIGMMYLIAELTAGQKFVSASYSDATDLYWGQVFNETQGISYPTSYLCGTLTSGPNAFWQGIGLGSYANPVGDPGDELVITLTTEVTEPIGDDGLTVSATGTLITGPSSTASVTVKKPVTEEPVNPTPTDPTPSVPTVPYYPTRPAAPEEEIPEEETPLTPPDEEILEEETPLAPPEEEEIPEEEIPLVDAPKTGDSTGVWMMLAMASVIGLSGAFLKGKKRKTFTK